MPDKVLLVGGGGREHALAWKLAQSPYVEEVLCAPGNGGTAGEPKCRNTGTAVNDFEGLTRDARDHQVDLVVVGPDNPLADGLVDHLQSHQFLCFGPNREQARLEWSKSYARQFCSAAGLPGPRSLTADSLDQALGYARDHEWARVVKADGLALGKGVTVCQDLAATERALRELMEENRCGAAGKRIVLEERLSGPEVSLMLLCDGRRLMMFPPCRDHKRRLDNDRGPNTGGMGAYCPVFPKPPGDASAGQELDLWLERLKDFSLVTTRIVFPLQRALEAGLLDYRGLLYVGLMLTRRGPMVLEFNARFGDPETQALLPLLHSDLYLAFQACALGRLTGTSLQFSDQACCAVVAVAETYPEKSSQGAPIRLPASPGAKIFHAGTRLGPEGLLTDGGRILSAAGLGEDLAQAREAAYRTLSEVSFPGMAFRSDIARG